MLRSELMAVLSKLALVLALCAAVPVAFWLALARTNAEVERATATAVGQVERVERGRGSSAVVTWTDAHGARHSGKFSLSDPDRYHPGDAYPLRYDPDGTDPRAVPAEAEDVSDLRDLQLVPLLLSAAAGAAVAVFWAGRAARYLLVLRSPSLPGTARAGRAPHGRNASRPVVHVRWSGPSGAVHEGWQPVVPGRAEAALRGSDAADGTAVTVHQRTAGGRVVLVLPNGSSLVPSDRLHPGEPPGWDDCPEAPLLYRSPPPPKAGWQLRCAFTCIAAGAVTAPAAWSLTGQGAATATITLVVATFAAMGMWLRELQRAY
ncbi:hypothetical protein [Kitasatospora sp. NPDC004289]